jgi:hypothetical protein
MERDEQAADQVVKAVADAEWFFLRKRSRREGAKNAYLTRFMTSSRCARTGQQRAEI